MAKAVKEDFGWLGTQTHAAIREAVANDLSDRHAIATFNQVIEYGTGVFMGPYAWGLQKARQKVIEAQTEEIAAALEEHGERARYATTTVRKSLVTNQVVPVEAWRNICFLPAVAQKNRRDFINDLGYFLENVDPHGGRYHKYFVLTFGRRQDLPAFGDMAKALDEANRKMEDWREMCREEHGIHVHSTALEWTVDEDRTYHLHANILAKTPFMQDAETEFREFAAKSEKILGGKFLNAGAIRNIREIIKYPFKPWEMKNASSDELFWLFKETFGRRIVRFHGCLAKFRKDRKEDSLRVFKLRNKFRLREVAPILPRDNGYSELEMERMAQQDQLAQQYVEAGLEPPDRGNKEGTNILLARVAPNFEHTLWAEPSVLIMNYDPQPAETDKKGHRRLETLFAWQSEALEAWTNAGAPAPDVALTIAQAAAQGPDNAHNIRALWKVAGPHAVELDALKGAPGSYVVHNGTITPREVGGDCELIEDPPPPETFGNIIPIRSDVEIYQTQTKQEKMRGYLGTFGGEVVDADPWFWQQHGKDTLFTPEIREFDDVPF